MTSEAVPLSAAPFRPVADFANILRSEFCKLRSVRSTVWTLGAAVAFNVGLAMLAGIFIPGRLSTQERATVDMVRLGLAGLHLSQIAFGVLGTLVITSEYGTGLIRATFTAVPQRRLVLASKAIVLSVTALVVGIGSSFAAYFAFQASLCDESFRTSIGDPGVLRAVAGGGLYLTALGLLGFGLGAIIRSSAGTIATLFGLLFVPPILLGLLPQSWQTAIRPYVPLEAGSQIFVATVHDPGSLGAWSGFGVFTFYTILALIGGFALIKKRDA
jgi:hypothetical protein